MSGALAGKTVAHIAGNRYTMFAITTDGEAYAWGTNSTGQFGNGTTTSSSEPVAVNMAGVLSGKKIKHIDIGNAATLALTEDDKLYAWGNNYSGQLGNGTTTGSNVPIEVNVAGVLSGLLVKKIASGNSVSCVIAGNVIDNANDQAYCWGMASGTGTNTNSGNVTTPKAVINTGVLSGLVVKDIAAGNYASCVVAGDPIDDTSDSAYCWGNNYDGALGDGSSNYSNSYTPVAVNATGALSGLVVKKIESEEYVCAIAGQPGSSSSDNIYCWGNNYFGQLGNGNSTSQNSPTAVITSGILSGLTVRYVIVNDYVTCALANDSRIYCWGSGSSGSLGNGTSSSSNVPVAVSPITFDVIFDPSGTPARCNNVTVVNSTTLTCTTSAHPAGLVSISLNNGTDAVTLPAVYTNPSGDLTDPSNVASGFLYEEPYLTLSTTGDVSFSITPTPTGVGNHSSTTVTTATNNPKGSITTLKSSGANLVCATNSSYTIPSATNSQLSSSSGQLPTNTWGYTTGTGPPTTYLSIPTIDTDISLPSQTASGTASQTVYFGTKVNTAIPSCAYKQTVTFTGVGRV
jgi:alpha-tubulin suppressor-like RCC1 family protein